MTKLFCDICEKEIPWSDKMLAMKFKIKFRRLWSVFYDWEESVLCWKCIQRIRK